MDEVERQLRDLDRVCRELAALRRQAEQLERRRDELIRTLRRAGVRGRDLAATSGLSVGRVAQIAGPNGRS